MIHHHPELARPEAFTREPLGWVPWLEPLAKEELTERHYAGLIERARADFAYFRLLARDPELLGARTRLDNDIFFTEDAGLPRAERELAAAAASRVNGCVFCASVHARAAARLSGRPEDVDRLLDEGTGAELGERWEAIVAAAEALTATPVRFGPGHVERLRAAGLGDDEILDVIGGAAFFNWANRLMLSLGEPEVPARRRS
ncbi:alkylhydroperoxidase domain protein, Avi_7169 family [Georgenia satyanarayanai]|uniref:Alkylhydroperoxidase domain protein, Avi_7169 family n=1 Tax=Georgenia satyanarayanai TaxID=860221 RepID=A0A2Y9A7Z8_9MICO|nr:alkylhydroperoxidase domain protein [Georgenia satyanarayanai]PYG00073.1 alkylhydroperoxidase domain protein [Georgenia satyanarayanai]SSA40096.1 alkylhydroperoxidase domain protein, Avi_7169 family [Georgenia satyanarayanai]